MNPISNAQVVAGAQMNLVQNAAAGHDSIIDLDAQEFKGMDPAKALQTAFAAHANVEFKKDNIVSFNKGFRPQEAKNKDIPIELHAFSNGGGPECYSLTRYWTITYRDSAKQEHTLNFKKEIYTSVEIPQGYQGHRQQQYVAALAARTYSNIVESMMRSNAGAPDALHANVGTHLTKVAQDQFIRMEMFGKGGNRLTINPKHSKFFKDEIKDESVHQIRVLIRTGSKSANEKNKGKPELLEDRREGSVDIKLREIGSKSKDFQTRADEYYANKYVLKSNPGSSQHVQNVSLLSQKKEILDGVEKHQLTPEQACENVGVQLSEFRAFNQEQLNRTSQEFVNHSNLFKDKKQLLTLMQKYGRDPESNKPKTISEYTLQLLPPKAPEGLVEKTKERLGRGKKLEDLALLQAIASLDNSTLTAVQKNDLDNLVNAYEKAYQKMCVLNEEITAIEKDFETMGFALDDKQIKEREAKLAAIKEHLTTARSVLTMPSTFTGDNSVSNLSESGESSDSEASIHVNPSNSSTSSSD